MGFKVVKLVNENNYAIEYNGNGIYLGLNSEILTIPREKDANKLCQILNKLPSGDRKRKLVVVLDDDPIMIDNSRNRVARSLIATVKLIEEKAEVIYTNQLNFLDFDYTKYENGAYRLFARKNGVEKEFMVGMTDCNGKEVRYAHNLEKMLLNGLFNYLWSDSPKEDA